jgi:Mg-chelatase subunit ChlD
MTTATPTPINAETATIAHIFFLLDRSGSMESIAADVIGGFNAFVAEQLADGPDALMTLVQFDSGDAQEVLVQARPLAEVQKLSATTFQPRGGTPLFDAMGHAIATATIRAETVAGTKPAEQVIFVTFTDGEENSSTEYTREKIFNLVRDREAKGWTFVFLGANQDAYAEGGAVGGHAANIANFTADALGTSQAFDGLSGALKRERGKMRRSEVRNQQDFFEGEKPSEAGQ